MKKMLLRAQNIIFINLLIISLIIGLFMEGSYSAQLTKKALTRSSDEAAVSIGAVFLNPVRDITEDELVFEIRMNTHAVDLNRYEMDELTFLKDDKGNVYEPLGWFYPGGGGHHRFGVIKFSSRKKDGSEIVNKDTEYIILLIKGIAGVEERSFKWDYPLQ